MNGKGYLLYTNIVIGLFVSDPIILQKIKLSSGVIAIPLIVIGELFYGAEKSTKKEQNNYSS